MWIVDIEWPNQLKDWKKLCCIGAIHTEFETKKGKSSEWLYYISSRVLTWTVASSRANGVACWNHALLLDMQFDEDWFRVLDRTIQENLNILHKIALNTIKLFKSDTSSRKAISKIMLDYLLNPSDILKVINSAVVQNWFPCTHGVACWNHALVAWYAVRWGLMQSVRQNDSRKSKQPLIYHPSL